MAEPSGPDDLLADLVQHLEHLCLLGVLPVLRVCCEESLVDRTEPPSGVFEATALADAHEFDEPIPLSLNSEVDCRIADACRVLIFGDCT